MSEREEIKQALNHIGNAYFILSRIENSLTKPIMQSMDSLLYYMESMHKFKDPRSY